MKKRKIQLSLYVVIPFIFAGLAILSVYVTYQFTLYWQEMGIELTRPVFYLAFAISIITFLVAYVITHIILKPLKVFLQKAEELTALGQQDMEVIDVPQQGRREPLITQEHELARLTSVTSRLTNILSKVQSRELFPNIVGQSEIMRGVFGQIVKVAKTDSTVLITGESGTGKELIAQAVYEHSSRADKPFVKLNCAAIPENLLESELFGHEKGAFTGAQTRKVGKFELANHGTIFLDEIGDMPLPLQSKILRVLQEKEIEPVGGGHPKKIDVRFVAATNKNIEKMVAEGDFREDLFFRLNVFAIILPPLRYRREDIPHLVRHFLDKHSGKHGCSPSAMDVLMRQEWPGNIRELQNVVERAILEAGDIKDIKPDHLPLDAAPSLGNADAPALDQVVPDEESSLDDYLAETEKNIIMNALHEAQGIQAKAARRLGIKERSLWHRVKKYEINAADYKPDKK